MTSYPATTEILLDHQHGWLTIRLNRPEVRNAISGEMTKELRAVAEALRGDPSIRGVTIRGAGGTFSAGGDIKGFKTVLQGDSQPEDVKAFSRKAGELFHRINELPQVVVVLVEGAAFAGGLGLACVADIVIATEDAKFALTETQIGIPPAQIAPLVAQRIGLAAARRIMLTAARFDGRGAKEIGLVDFVAADAAGLDALEADIRRSVLACAPGANAATKEILLAARTLHGDRLVDFAAERFAASMLGEEGREGIAAFLEKRKPRWAE